MKKALFVGMGLIAMLSLASTPIFGCDEHKDANATSASASGCSGGTANAKLVGASGCSASHEANAKMAGEKGVCPVQCSPEMEKFCKMTSAELSKFANYDGQVQLVPMSIKGMTCGGCESSVSAALTKTEGVVKVLAISYKDGTALVLVDPTKAKTESLATVVTNKGYEAQVIPAVAHMTNGTAGKSCSATGSNAGAKTSCEGKTATDAQTTSAKQPN